MSADPPDNDADLDRLIRICQKGLAMTRKEAEDESQHDLYLDTFAIVGVWAWRDEDDDECEGYTVWSETRRNHVQVGILLGGLQQVTERKQS